MAISSADDMGQYTDTGVGTAPTKRPSSDTPEIHVIGVVDTGAKTTPSGNGAARRSSTQRR